MTTPRPASGRPISWPWLLAVEEPDPAPVAVAAVESGAIIHIVRVVADPLRRADHQARDLGVGAVTAGEDAVEGLPSLHARVVPFAERGIADVAVVIFLEAVEERLGHDLLQGRAVTPRDGLAELPDKGTEVGDRIESDRFDRDLRDGLR